MTPVPWRTVVRDAGALLSFRISRERLDAFGARHLALGLVATWLVGIGRWWDDPRAGALQKSGLGSVTYVVLLSLALFVVAWPMKPRAWKLRHVLTFVTLTAPPAALYAIPVERFLAMSTAATVNLWFLLIVASWRVALLAFYFRRHAALAWWEIVTASLLPLASIVIVLSLLDLSRGVIAIMGGLRDASADRLASEIVFGLGMLAFVAIGPLLVIYAIAAVIARRRAGRRGD